MKTKIWTSSLIAATLFLTTACGNAGNTANTVGNAASNAAGLAANAVGGVANTAGSVIRGTQGRLATWDGHSQSISVNSQTKMVTVSLTRTANRANVGHLAAGLHAMNIHVPVGWTVRVAAPGDYTSGVVVITPYTHITGTTNRGTAGATVGTTSATHTGRVATFKATTPGRYAIALREPGRQMIVLNTITVSKAVQHPTVTSEPRLR